MTPLEVVATTIHQSHCEEDCDRRPDPADVDLARAIVYDLDLYGATEPQSPPDTLPMLWKITPPEGSAYWMTYQPRQMWVFGCRVEKMTVMQALEEARQEVRNDHTA